MAANGYMPDVPAPFLEGMYVPGDTAGVMPIVQLPGKEAEPIPYRMESDGVLTLCLLLCFFLSAYALARGKGYLLQQLGEIFRTRERNNLFAVETGSDVRYRVIWVGQTCLLCALLFYYYSCGWWPELSERYPSALLIGVYLLLIGGGYLLRMALFGVIDWIFFKKSKNIQWWNAYSLIYSLWGIGLFPLLLLTIYFDLPTRVVTIVFVVSAVLGEIMLLYKCFNIFFGKKCCLLHFIVYFCTLELVPCFLLWQALAMANNLLILK